MKKSIIINILIGGALFIVGGSLHDFAKKRELGNFLAYSGMIYSFIAVILIFVFRLPFVKNIINERKRNTVLKQKLTLKKLLKEELISQEEFDEKLDELKKKILNE